MLHLQGYLRFVECFFQQYYRHFPTLSHPKCHNPTGGYPQVLFPHVALNQRVPEQVKTIHIEHFILYANGIGFKNISGLVMGQTIALDMIGVICQINLCLVINTTLFSIIMCLAFVLHNAFLISATNCVCCFLR